MKYLNSTEEHELDAEKMIEEFKTNLAMSLASYS